MSQRCNSGVESKGVVDLESVGSGDFVEGNAEVRRSRAVSLCRAGVVEFVGVAGALVITRGGAIEFDRVGKDSVD